MSIQNSISLPSSHRDVAGLEKTKLWIHENPTAVKVIEIASLLTGIGMLVAIPLSAPLLTTGAVIGLALSGTALTTASSAALYTLDILIPPHHDMKDHVFTPGECEGGKLFYLGDVPVLTLNSDDSFKSGYAHGYLCGNAINKLTKRLDLIMHTLAHQKRASELPKTLEKIRSTIPADYFIEMQGIVAGYEEWSKKHSLQFPKKLSVDDILLLHLMPDSLHFDPSLLEHQTSQAGQESAVACTAIVDRDPQQGMVFARNMDWPSFGLAGSNSLLINRQSAKKGHSTLEVGIPGLVGTLTGMNDHGLALAMNVCSGYTREIRGMPASLFNRACLERCRTTADVDRFVSMNSPLGPYHLTIADRDSAKSFHFYQSYQETHTTRQLADNQPLVTLNYCYNPQPRCDMHHSSDRQQQLDQFFHRRENKPLQEALALPFVNNWLTTHRVVMEPKTGTFQVAFDNAFAGTAPLQSLLFKK